MTTKTTTMNDPVEDGRLDDVDHLDDPLWVRLLWDPDDEEWVTSTNAAAEPLTIVATALSSVLYRMAISDLRRRD